MAETISIEKFLKLSGSIPVIDVRSPAEYKQAHFPSAINIPLLDNEERKIVGTLYKKKSREEAIRTGFEIIAGKTSSLINRGVKAAKDSELLIYCWRGGMRSASLAWLFERQGINVRLLSGGYKNYRRTFKKYLSSGLNLNVVGGMTGSGKTEILKELKAFGCQVIDLEGIANHKGSAFGSLGEEEQPTTEQFENYLFTEFNKLDKSKPIWVEDESRNIGKVFIPDELFSLMRKSSLYVINMPKEKRIERLVIDYGKYPDELLIERVERIGRKIGGQNMKTAVEAIHNKNYKVAADISLFYYDKTYNFGLNERSDIQKFMVDCVNIDAKENAGKLLELINQK